MVELPHYQRLADELRTRITAGEWKIGDVMPGEYDLMLTHKLSRTTVRAALQALERAGLVTRIRGKGTFLAHIQPPMTEAELELQQVREALEVAIGRTPDPSRSTRQLVADLGHQKQGNLTNIEYQDMFRIFDEIDPDWRTKYEHAPRIADPLVMVIKGMKQRLSLFVRILYFGDERR